MTNNMTREKEYAQPAINRVEDLTARLIELNRTLEAKNNQLYQSELARKSMFSNITHDLRAPISVIRGAIDRLSSKESIDDEYRKILEIVNSRAMALEHLISDLYLSVLIDQPEFSLNLSCLEIIPILEEFFISMKGTGRLDNRQCRLNVKHGFSAHVMIDPQYFIRVLDNLLSNALHYTKSGDLIELGCRESTGISSNGVIEIYVRDTGPGIHTGDQPYIFDSTFTGEGARTPGKSGSGLGLSIAKSIIERHGGSIRCHSVYGEGATFTVNLPSVIPQP